MSGIRFTQKWSWFKKTLMTVALLNFATSSFLYLTAPGTVIREFLAQTVISTQHRDWAWIVVGADLRDHMVYMSHEFTASSALVEQDFDLIQHDPPAPEPIRRARTVDELISEPIDISGQFWKGKMIYVYDPTTVRVVVPGKPGEGERISSMVQRTGAVAGINGGGFIDPDGLGNGFAPIGLILSNGEPIYTDAEPYDAQHIIGFTNEGTLVVGKYSLNQLIGMGVKEAVSFLAPRLIANGIPQITSGDGGWGRAPRTAVGQKEDGTLLFIIIDGRQTGSIGATLKEVQDLMLKEGMVNAGLLDGGASSELVVEGELLTKPSSRYGERRLPSGLLVYDDPSTYVADRVWDGLLKIDAGGRHDHPDYLKEQEELKRKQQSQQSTQQNQQQTQTKTPSQTQLQLPNQTQSQTPGQAHTQPSEQTQAQPPGQSQTPTSGQTQAQPSGQSQTQTSGQTQAQPPGQSQTPTSGQTQAQPPGQSQTPTSGQTQAQPSGQPQTPTSGQTQAQPPK